MEFFVKFGILNNERKMFQEKSYEVVIMCLCCNWFWLLVDYVVFIGSGDVGNRLDEWYISVCWSGIMCVLWCDGIVDVGVVVLL